MAKKAKQVKKQAREAALAQFVSNAIDASASAVRVGGKPHQVYNPPVYTTGSYWRVGDTHTAFRVNVFYTDAEDEDGHVFEVTVREVSKP